MKKVFLTVLVIAAALAVSIARAEPTYTVVLAGGNVQNSIHIWLTSDGRSYVIDSIVPLEVGGTICENPPGSANELICKAPQVAGFEVNGGGGNDTVTVSGAIAIPVTMRGGAGDDNLVGGSGPDKLIGGEGADRLNGRGGDDLILGGYGNDEILGGPGNDVLRGGPGRDTILPGPGTNVVRQDFRSGF